MMKMALTSVAIAALWGGFLRGAVQESADGPAIRLRVVGCQDQSDLTIRYFLKGSFGGYGGFVRTESGRTEYIIPAVQQGMPAKVFQALVYCPGHQIALLQEPSFAEPFSQPTELRLAPLGSIRLAGTLMYPTAESVTGIRIEVDYLALWSHRFWGIFDGPVDSFKVASTDLSEDGSFEMLVPDFAHDPVVASYREQGVLRLTARESKTGSTPYELELTETPGRSAELVIASSYPRLELYRVPRR
jgi:hypothetical protein